MKKIIKSLVLISAIVFLNACSSTGRTSHHHHEPEFEGKCANNVVHGKHDIKGKKDINVTYKGKTYYFSSNDMRDHFISEIDSNIKRANEKWEGNKIHDRN